MREIKYIAIHCTATSQNTKVSSIKRYWRQSLGWKSAGYHHIVKPDGSAIELTPINEISNGVRGYNSNSINISYIGGIDENGKAFDNRTKEQKETLLILVKRYKEMFPDAIVQGHRDFLKRGTSKWKECPSFDAKNEYKNI
jgi:N-acetylmuramoyl-L-alanine amidase